MGKELLCVIGLMLATSASALQPSALPSNDYVAMTERLKDGVNDINFGQLRKAAISQAKYNGYDQLDIKPVISAFGAHDWTGVQTLCDKQLAHDYLDISAHLLDALAADKLGRPDAAALHRRIWHGMVDAILASGDGKSAQTAFHVIGVDEEYFILRIMRLKLGKQSLVVKDGAFDVLDVADEQGTQHELWFDISGFFGKSL
jgi:hypothetical protein